MTEELKLEGFARGLVRYVQEMRKQNDFDYLDRINIHMNSDDPVVSNALKSFRSYVMTETQADTLSEKNHEKAVENNIDGVSVRIYVKRV